MRAIKTMRLVVLLLLFSVGSVLFANAQEVRLVLQVKQKSLIEVIDILKQKTGFSFVYSAADAERVKGLTFDLKNKTIRKVLDAVLAKTNFVYTIDDKVIILKRKVPVRPAAKRTVRGVVVGTAPNDTYYHGGDHRRAREVLHRDPGRGRRGVAFHVYREKDGRGALQGTGVPDREDGG